MQNGWIQDGRIQDGSVLNPTWQNSRWLPSSSWVRMNKWSFFCAKMAESKDTRIQEGCHHQVEWEWMTLSQIELDWVRVLCNMAESQDTRIQDSSHPQVWVRMNKWSFFCAKWLNTRWQNSRWLPSISWVRMNDFESDWIRLSQSFVQHGWIQDGRIQDGLPSSS